MIRWMFSSFDQVKMKSLKQNSRCFTDKSLDSLFFRELFHKQFSIYIGYLTEMSKKIKFINKRA